MRTPPTLWEFFTKSPRFRRHVLKTYLWKLSGCAQRNSRWDQTCLVFSGVETFLLSRVSKHTYNETELSKNGPRLEQAPFHSNLHFVMMPTAHRNSLISGPRYHHFWSNRKFAKTVKIENRLSSIERFAFLYKLALCLLRVLESRLTNPQLFMGVSSVHHRNANCFQREVCNVFQFQNKNGTFSVGFGENQRDTNPQLATSCCSSHFEQT